MVMMSVNPEGMSPDPPPEPVFASSNPRTTELLNSKLAQTFDS